MELYSLLQQVERNFWLDLVLPKPSIKTSFCNSQLDNRPTGIFVQPTSQFYLKSTDSFLYFFRDLFFLPQAELNFKTLFIFTDPSDSSGSRVSVSPALVEAVRPHTRELRIKECFQAHLSYYTFERFRLVVVILSIISSCDKEFEYYLFS